MPGFPPDAPPFPPGRAPFPPPPFLPPGISPPGGGSPGVFPLPPPPTFVPAQTNQSQPPPTSPPVPPTSKGRSEPAIPRPEERIRQLVLILPNQAMSRTNADFKKATELKVQDANFSSVTIFFHFTCPLFHFDDPGRVSCHSSEIFGCPYFRSSYAIVEDSRGKKRACKGFLVIRMWVRLVIPRESCEPFYLFLSFSCAIRGLSVHPICELPSTFLWLYLYTLF